MYTYMYVHTLIYSAVCVYMYTYNYVYICCLLLTYILSLNYKLKY